MLPLRRLAVHTYRFFGFELYDFIRIAWVPEILVGYSLAEPDFKRGEGDIKTAEPEGKAFRTVAVRTALIIKAFRCREKLPCFLIRIKK